MKKAMYSLIFILFITLPAFAGETVTISPSWKQAFQFANKSGQAVWTTLGIVLLAIAVIIIIWSGKDAFAFLGLRSGVAVNVICTILFGLGLLAIFNKPSSIKWNNDKVIEKSWLEYKGEKYMWDSLEVNCLIIDGPKDCYTGK
jgi:hypothetical protein